MSVRHLAWMRGAAAVLATAVLAVTAAGCASTPTPGSDSTSGGDTRTINIGWQTKAPFTLPALLAADNSLEPFTSRGLNFSGGIVSANDAIPLLATGKLDVYVGPVSAGVFNAIGSGSDLAVVGSGCSNLDASNWYISKAALGDKDPNDISNWKGQKVYTSTGAGSYVMISLAHILEPAGLEPTDLQFAQISPDDVGAALTNGSLFAGIPPSVTVRQSLLDAGSVVEGPSAVWPDGVSPGYIFFGESLLKDDPALAQKILDAFVDLYKNYLKPGFQDDPSINATIAKVLDYKVEDLKTLLNYTYPADLALPDVWAKTAEDTWRSLPDVLSYKDSVADKVIDQDLIDKAVADVK